MAVVFRDASSTASSDITIPATVQDNDLLVAIIGVNSNTPYVITPPAGWTEVEYATGGGSGQPGGTQLAAVYSRRAVAADAGSLTDFVVSPNTGKETTNLAAYYSDDPALLVSVGVSAQRLEDTAGLTDATPAVTVAALPATLLAGIHKKGTTVSSITAPSGYTLRGTPALTTGSSNNGTALADAAASATGSTSATWTTSASSTACSTFLMTLVEGEPPPPPEMNRPVMRRWNGVSWTLVG